MYDDAEYLTLLDLFIRLVESQNGKKTEPGEEWLNDAQVLAAKLFRHLVSMRMLADGGTVERDGCPNVFFVDHASVKVIARAALETYLVFFYIYGGSDRSLSKFRHQTWHLGGLADRQKFHASTEEGREVLAREKRGIRALRAKIERSAKIRAYTEKQRHRLLQGEWRIRIRWVDIGISAGFHEKFFTNVYGYLCGYAHSSYLSALQVRDAESVEDQKMLTLAFLGLGTVLMANFASSYPNVFDTAKAILSADPHAKHIADKWCFGSDEMAAFFDC